MEKQRKDLIEKVAVLEGIRAEAAAEKVTVLEGIRTENSTTEDPKNSKTEDNATLGEASPSIKPGFFGNMVAESGAQKAKKMERRNGYSWSWRLWG